MNHPNPWTAQQDADLTQWYGQYPAKEVAQRLGRSTAAIANRAMALGVNLRRRQWWTLNEEETIKRDYPRMSPKELLQALPGRTWSKVKAKAVQLGIGRLDFNRHLIKADVRQLLDGSFHSCYWLGFLLADGHFGRRKRLKLLLALKDAHHVRRFADHIRCTNAIAPANGGRAVFLTVQDSRFVTELCNRFDIQSNKTKNPPRKEVFDQLTDDQFVAMLVGFIDGDGYIKLRHSGTNAVVVKCHSSWLSVLNGFLERLNRISEHSIPLGKLNSLGYAEIHITRQSVCRYLKLAVLRLELPVLARKWDLIDKDRFSRTEKTA